MSTQILDTTTTDKYKQLMQTAIRLYSKRLRNLGYDPNNKADFETMAYIVWVWLND